MGRPVMGYDVGLLTPAGPTKEHHAGTLSVDGVWATVTHEGTFVAAWPSHAVYSITACAGGPSCGAV